MPNLAVDSDTEVFRIELRKLLKVGLPITELSASEILTSQRAVIANAAHPNELASKITSLERLLKRLLSSFGSSVHGQVARILFASEKGYRGTTLTYRRIEASVRMERSVDHLRKHIEPRILADLAFLFHQENLQYIPVSKSGRPELGTPEDLPIITDESFSEKEELISRIWSSVYGFRAELIATKNNMPGEDKESPSSFLYYRDSANWKLAQLLTDVSSFIDKYGDEILSGEVPYNVEGLVALAGWNGGMTSDYAKYLRVALAKSGRDDREAFLKELEHFEKNKT